MRLPIRIQRSCARGWRMPAHAKYVGPGSFYGNPFSVARMPLELKYGGAIMVASPAKVVEKFREWTKHTPEGRFVAECAARNLWSPSTSSAAAAHAKTSASQANAQAWPRAHAQASGNPWPPQSKPSDPASWCGRTCQEH